MWEAEGPCPVDDRIGMVCQFCGFSAEIPRAWAYRHLVACPACKIVETGTDLIRYRGPQGVMNNPSVAAFWAAHVQAVRTAIEERRRV